MGGREGRFHTLEAKSEEDATAGSVAGGRGSEIRNARNAALSRHLKRQGNRFSSRVSGALEALVKS